MALSATERLPRTHEDVAARAIAGDRQALSRLLTRLAPLMLSTSRRILGPGLTDGATDAEDAVQEALVDLARGLPNLRDPKRVEAYAVRITARRAIRARRRRHEPTSTPDGLADQQETADQALMRRRKATALLALLDELPEKQAEALYLRVALGYSLAEAATTMNVSANTIRSRVRLAYEQIRKKLEKRPALRQLLEGER